MEKLNLHSPDFTQANIAKLAELFPHCVTETGTADGTLKKAIDFDLLRQELSTTIVEGIQERYQLNWPGKREALLTANTPIAKTLRPCREESVDFDSTQNLYIEGDNLDALKLLQETYLGKVKMIYIDPPYNTGNDFIYDDDFAEETGSYLLRSNQKDEEGNRLVANNESNGRFHSDWLSMMYPRLKLARNLLRDDGCVFISIDDGENANLRKLCDEIFGSENFLAEFIWKKRTGSNDAKNMVSLDHDYVLAFSKSSIFSLNGVIKDSSNVWVYERGRMEKNILEDKIIFPKNGIGTPMYKRHLSELRSNKKPYSSILNTVINTIATKETRNLLGGQYFDYPKSIDLLKQLINQSSSSLDIILDFFSGSATTAHAVMQLNAEDGGKRKFIMVQLPEPCDEKSEAFKAGYKTITEIGKERIRRAGQKIKTENADKENIAQLDIGFRVLKIDSSNMNDIYYSPHKVEQNDLHRFVDNIREDRTAEDLLFQVLLDWGVDLTLPITQEVIAGKIVLFVDDNALAACFDDAINEDLVKILVTRQPLRVVFRDTSFTSDSVKINSEQIFKALSPDTDIKTL